jgi:SAM-dependent methyltransferase
MTAVPGHAPPAATRPSAAEIQSLDSYVFLVVLGKRVIHPGGRRSTQQLLELASLAAGQQVLDIGCGVATTIQVAQRFNAQVTAADLAPLMRGGPAPAGRAPTRLLEFIRSQPEGTSRGRHGRARRRLRLDTYGHYPEHTAAIRAWRARLPA